MKGEGRLCSRCVLAGALTALLLPTLALGAARIRGETLSGAKRDGE
jgi:hypothetical protein